jgi:hypothetical protein
MLHNFRVIFLDFVTNKKSKESRYVGFLSLTPCRLTGDCQRFGWTHCIHLQGKSLPSLLSWRMRHCVSPKRCYPPTRPFIDGSTALCWILAAFIFVSYATRRKVAGSIPDEVTGCFNWPNPSSRTMALESTQPLTELNTRNLPGGKGRPRRKADNLTAICEPIV